jgi:hypothetical protein
MFFVQIHNKIRSPKIAKRWNGVPLTNIFFIEFPLLFFVTAAQFWYNL